MSTSTSYTKKADAPTFNEDERRDIVRILMGRSKDPDSIAAFSPGARVGHLLRMHPRIVASPRTQMILRHIADVMREMPTTSASLENTQSWGATVPESTLAKWSGCSLRQVKREIRELKGLTGAWPLLACTIGSNVKHRASEYRLVINPFAFAVKLDADAKDAAQRRHAGIIRGQAAALRAQVAGEISADAAEARQLALSRQRTWNTRRAS